MSGFRFRFSTQILARLGEELNPTIDQGVLELVKNAHDADARECEVALDGVDRPGGTLTIRDDGDGMTAEDLRDKFLLLGSSSKEATRTTRRGRIPAGSKGLGRLAALRAGTTVRLTTRPRTDKTIEHRLSIEWSLYDAAEAVDDVELQVETNRRPQGARNGTTIEIAGLKRSVGRTEAKRLARALLLLADPFDDDPRAFRPTLESETFADLASLVQAKYFDSAEYHLVAKVDSRGVAHSRVLDWKGQELYSASHGALRGTADPYAVQNVDFEFWVFILDSRTFSTRDSTLGEVREWLREFGGVMLYINGLRVPPYGDPGNDWLDINLRRAQSPEERPSTQTSIGRLRVGDSHGHLQAKTDRGGLIDTPPFADLRRFAQDALEWMAKERLRVAENRRQREREEAPKQSFKSRDRIEAAIANSDASGKPELAEAFRQYDRAREREVRGLRDEVQLYRTLSTAGITAATFAHESSNGPLKVIGRAVAALRRRVRGGQLPAVAQDVLAPLDQIQSSADSLMAFGDTTLELVSKDKRRSGRVDINTVTTQAIDSYRPFLEARGIDVQLELSDDRPSLQGSVAAVESIVVNLITNAMTALMTSRAQKPLIRVATRVSDSTVLLTVDDNGAGVQGISLDDIWLPGKSTRLGGSGLGLTIVRDSAVDLGGRASVSTSALGGAAFRVALPILGG